MVVPPSEVTLPPQMTEVDVILLTALVVTVGNCISAVVVKLC